MQRPLSFFSALLVIGFLGASCSQQLKPELTPAQYAQKISDIIVNGTDFRFEPALQEFQQDGVYMYEFPSDKKGVFYARSVIKVDGSLKLDTDTYFAITNQAGSIEVQIDGTPIYRHTSKKTGHFKYVDYNLFEWEGYVPVDLEDGVHQLTIKFIPHKAGENRIYFAFIRADNGLGDPSVTLRSPSEKEELAHYGYWWIGPFDDASHDEEVLNPSLTESELVEQQFSTSSGTIRWDLPALHLVKSLPGWLTFQNWHYSGGTFLDAMAEVSQHFEELDYTGYIQEHTQFLESHIDEIAEMREDYGLIESPFGHYFRFSLLDDMGMQTVPFVNKLIQQPEELRDRNSFEYQLAERVTTHIMEKASRLDDGTYARFTPDTMTVWADDLFMSSIVLLKMYDLTGDSRFLEQVVFQVLKFDEYLRDPSDNIYWHGYFSRTGENSSTKWGRANGWTIMTKVELLNRLPQSHPQYQAVLTAFSRHCEGLLAVQSPDGRWHQVLDDPTSYLETSATAMFIRGFAAGVNNGWLDYDTYAPAIERGWAALTRQFDEEGNVVGIVRGTPIMFSDEEYNNWGTRINDPRGLGALLYAAIEVDKFQQGRK